MIPILEKECRNSKRHNLLDKWMVGSQGQRTDVLSSLVLHQSPTSNQSFQVGEAGPAVTGCCSTGQRWAPAGAASLQPPAQDPRAWAIPTRPTCFQGSTCAAVFLEKGKSRAGPEADAASGVEEQQYWAARGGTGCVHGVAQSKHRARAEHTATGSVRNYSCGAQYQIHFDVICHMVLVYRYGLHVSPIVCCKVIPGQQSHQVVDSCRSYCTEQYFIQSS